jgi:hypothetical protein
VFRLVNKIQIGGYGFTGCVSVQIVKSRENFTQTAIIEMPNILYKQTGKPVFISNADMLTNLITRGDIVKIWNGYDKNYDNLSLKFRGFVTRIQPDDIIKIYCEDYAYVLKQINVPSESFTNATIKDIVEHVLQDANITVEYDDEDMIIGDWVIDNNSNVNAVQVLDKLDDFGVRVYFQDNVLKVGGLTDTTGNTKCFIFEHNIINSNLVFRSDNDVNMVLKGISNLDTDEKIERYAYLDDGEIVVKQTGISGEQRTLNYYNKSADELEEILENNFNKYIYNGYSGNYQTLLEPFVSVNDFVNLYSMRFPERNSQYKVKSVVTDISVEGGYQTVELDYKIKDL